MNGWRRPLPFRLASLVKLEHTIFALPFAYMGALTALGRFPDARTALLILLAMAGARTAAMTFNRIVDLPLDRRNPRTAQRELVTGEVSQAQARALLVISAGVFFAASWMLNPLAFTLSPLALAIILGYSYTKRFTPASHLFLGASLGIAPVGGWIAVTGEWSSYPLILGAAVAAWTAGFDIIYALLDTEFDRREKLHSIPAAIGEENALYVSRALHAAMIVLLVWYGRVLGLGSLYVIGVFVVGAFLVWEHTLVSPQDKSRVNTAFFTMNGIVSILLFVFTLLDALRGRWQS
ncbi:MAG: 4-hydroxybenzoate octaprenyltransferase [Armatimonadota bacterium]|nr:MAG: 4-hydroxybenzoate octaprenyltransferase [Armatimonadota bacterium]